MAESTWRVFWKRNTGAQAKAGRWAHARGHCGDQTPEDIRPSGALPTPGSMETASGLGHTHRCPWCTSGLGSHSFTHSTSVY